MEVAVTNIMLRAVVAFGVSVIVLEHTVVTAKSDIPVDLQKKFLEAMLNGLVRHAFRLGALETQEAEFDGGYWIITQDDPVLHIAVKGTSLGTVRMRETQMFSGKFRMHFTVQFKMDGASIALKGMNLVKLSIGEAGIEILYSDIDKSFNDMIYPIQAEVKKAISSALKAREVAAALKQLKKQ